MWQAIERALLMMTYEFDENDRWWGCRHCNGEKYDHPERHNPADCPVAAAQVALKLMKEHRCIE